MVQRRYQQVRPRTQGMLLPKCLDDYVSEHNSVRSIDAFVDTLDLQELGFEHAKANSGDCESLVLSQSRMRHAAL